MDRREDVLALAQKGDAEAMYAMATIYDKDNPAQALKWLEKSAFQGYRKAVRSWAERLETGNGVKQNKEEATYLYLQCAIQGCEWSASWCNVHHYAPILKSALKSAQKKQEAFQSAKEEILDKSRLDIQDATDDLEDSLLLEMKKKLAAHKKLLEEEARPKNDEKIQKLESAVEQQIKRLIEHACDHIWPKKTEQSSAGADAEPLNTRTVEPENKPDTQEEHHAS